MGDEQFPAPPQLLQEDIIRHQIPESANVETKGYR